MSQVTITSLLKKKQNKEAFAVVTCYDAGFATRVEKAGIDAILVGDSLGMVVQGQKSTLPVTVQDMIYHTQCVSRGVSRPLIITDMPFGSYNSVDDCLRNATALMQAGAEMVKLEGGNWLCDSIIQLNRSGIPVCGHLGLTPQSVNLLGGYRVQGREENQAEAMLADAQALQSAGASLLVLECVPKTLATRISATLSIPVIGIGAGNQTDAQVLVLHDLLGVTEKTAKFVRNFADGSSGVEDALLRYRIAVEDRSFPGDEHTFA